LPKKITPPIRPTFTHNLFFSNGEKQNLPKRLLKKMDFANQNDKRTRTKILENLTLLENLKANEAKPALQT